MRKKTSPKNSPPKRKFYPLPIIVISGTILLLMALFSLNWQNKPYKMSSVQPPLDLSSKNSKAPTITPKVTGTATATAKIIIKPVIPVHSGNQLRVPILMYHYVGNNPNPADRQRDTLSISPDKFEAQVKYLRDNGYTSISLDTLYAALKKQTSLPAKPVILTFDDGYIDFYVNAYPILKAYNISATVFVITGFVGQPAYLTWPQIKEMSDSQSISIEAHTVHHSHLPSISDDAAVYELAESKKMLEQMLGIPVNFIAYPFGSTDERIMNIAKNVGFVGGVGTWPDKIQSEGAIYDLPRERINGSVDLANFITKL
jgi:peptidoglycan/xylan/chitin deacetylase (PgdA/CDA1 family)